jgi:hypothetical protein
MIVIFWLKVVNFFTCKENTVKRDDSGRMGMTPSPLSLISGKTRLYARGAIAVRWSWF